MHRQRGRVGVWVVLVLMSGALLGACSGGAGGDGVTGSDPATGQNGDTLAGGSSVSDGEASAVQPFEMEITVTHWPTLMYGVPYMVALEKGYFEEEGIRITGIVGSEGGGTTVRNVLTGGLPFGEVATPAAVNAWLAGAPLVVVGGGLANVDEILWVSLPGSGLTSLEDLVDRKVGFTNPGSVAEGVLNLSLARAGIPVEKVERIAAGGLSEGLTALAGGALDAMANIEPIFSARGGTATWDVVFQPRDYVPWFQQTVIITSPTFLENHPEVARGFLRARARGVRFIQENPEEAARIYASYSELPEEATLGALRTVNVDTFFGVGFNADGLAAVEEEMVILDLVPEGESAPWSQLIRQDFLPDDVERIDLESLGSDT